MTIRALSTQAGEAAQDNTADPEYVVSNHRDLPEAARRMLETLALRQTPLQKTTSVEGRMVVRLNAHEVAELRKAALVVAPNLQTDAPSSALPKVTVHGDTPPATMHETLLALAEMHERHRCAPGVVPSFGHLGDPLTAAVEARMKEGTFYVVGPQ